MESCRANCYKSSVEYRVVDSKTYGSSGFKPQRELNGGAITTSCMPQPRVGTPKAQYEFRICAVSAWLPQTRNLNVPMTSYKSPLLSLKPESETCSAIGGKSPPKVRLNEVVAVPATSSRKKGLL